MLWALWAVLRFSFDDDGSPDDGLGSSRQRPGFMSDITKRAKKKKVSRMVSKKMTESSGPF